MTGRAVRQFFVAVSAHGLAAVKLLLVAALPRLASALLGFATRDQLATAYLDATGRSRAHLDYWHVLGLWKIAIIAEGVLRRSLEDPRNAVRADAPTAGAVASAVERAWSVAESTGLADRGRN